MKARKKVSTRKALSRQAICITLLVLISAWVFSNTLDNEYHLDSIHRVEVNTEIDHFWPPDRFFTDIRTGSTVPQIAEYRPMMPLSHSINYQIAKAFNVSRLAGFHIGNIAIHISTTVLIYFLFNLLVSNWSNSSQRLSQLNPFAYYAFAAALLFAIHPVSGSAVNYIAARDLLLMVFFFVLFLLVYFNMRNSGDSVIGWISALLLLCLAILSKQVAIVGFGMVFLFEWIVARQKLTDWRVWARTALASLPTIGFFILRKLWILKQNPEDPLRTPEGILYPLTMAKAHVFYYLKNIAWPFEMRALAKFDMVDSLLDPGAMVAVFFIISTLLIAFWLIRRQPLVSFAIFSYWLLFALTASIFPFRYIVTDYRQYLPSVFLYFLVGLGLWKLNKPTLSFVLVLLLTLYFSLASRHINQHWKTEESFWEQSVKYGAVALAHQNYGLIKSVNNPALAEKHYLEALRQSPNHIYASINLGLLNIKMGKKEEGLQRLRNITALNPEWALTHYWLAIGLKKVGEQDESLKEMIRASELDERSLKYQYEAARALQDASLPAKSIPYYQRVVLIDPDYEMAGFWLAFAYQKTNQPQLAIDGYLQFLDHHPRHYQSEFNLAYALMGENRCADAIEHFNRVLELSPDYDEVHIHLKRCQKELDRIPPTDKANK